MPDGVRSVTTNPDPPQLGVLARVVIALAIVLAIAGLLWHGISADTFPRIWRNLVARPGGPMKFRFILQPSMAAIAAIHDGLRDARSGRAPYFWTMLHNPQKRMERLREGLNATAKIILLGLAMDAIYQFLALGTFHPNEALIIVVLLAFVPYVILRGLVLRVWRAEQRPLGSGEGEVPQRHQKETEHG
jgi:hypothetical protein